MDRYISIESLKRILKKIPYKIRGRRVLQSLIDNTLSADVKPVVYAHWIPYGENENGKVLMKCSHCGIIGIGHSKYCGGCGSLMDKKVKENV